VIQENIYAQLRASQAIFSQVRALASIAEAYKLNTNLTKQIEMVMKDLLKTGEELSDQAKRTGAEVFAFIRAE
jgi:Zn-dependent oligopeptidase